MTPTDRPREQESRNVLINVVLAASIITAWLVAHIYSVFFFELSSATALFAVGLILLNTWLSVGLFIIAHDCMHGSLVPYHPAVNRAVGQLCLSLYGGFSFNALNRKHHLHHRHSGSHQDPDFREGEPYGFWRWFGKFLGEYFSWRQYAHMTIRFLVYVFVLGATIENALLLWCLPAILSALQLFTFGTYLPHRPRALPFADRHRARSNEYSWMVSLLTCFHFGYHHEHHLEPKAPWWKLPEVRKQFRKATHPTA